MPAYIYLDASGTAEWAQLFKASSRVPIVAIVNPASGPGAERDPKITTLFKQAEKSGATLIGYVDTTYGRRPIQDVKAEVDKWIRFYPRVQGILLDQQASEKERVDYYGQLYQYIRGTCGLKLVASNPGTLCDESYFSGRTADVVCLHEGNQVLPGSFFPAWTARYPSTDVFFTQYGVKTEEEMQSFVRFAVEKKFSYIYVTDRDGGNPWDHLPAYWAAEVDAVEKVNR